MHALLDALPLPTLRLDAARRIVAANLPAQEALNRSAARLLGVPVETLFAPADEVARLFARAAERPAATHALRIGTEPATAWLAADGEAWLMQFAREGARAEIEELAHRREKADAIARVALELAHEIKNPLAALRGAAQWLAGRVGHDPGLQEAAQRMMREADRVRARIDALLQLGPRAPIPMRPLNLHRLIDEVSRPPEGVRLRRIFDPGLPEIIAHEGRLRQAIENLWVNAIEAGASWIEWRTSAAPLARPPGIRGQIVELRITNDGASVPASVRDHAFEPFVTSKARGGGLGLAIVERVMREHGGRALMVAERGRTSVILQLPVRPPEGEARCDC